MEYRPLGNTGMQASVVGLGTEHLDGKPYETAEAVVREAIDHGVNIMDLFMPGEEVRTNIGRALAGSRDKMPIQGHIGSVDLSQQYDISRDLDVCKRYFENLLRCLKTDYIDLGMLFFLDSHQDIDAVLDNGLVEYAAVVSRFRTDSHGQFKGSCVHCNHCLPCPSEIDIAALTKYLDVAILDAAHIPPSIRQHYDALSAHGSDCVACGSCEERCPFSVPVMDNMRKAADLFGK